MGELPNRESNYFDAAYDVYFNSVNDNAGNKFEKALWSAWGTGGAFMEGGLSRLSEFDTVADSLEKAKCLVNLLIQPMVSFWFHNWDSQEEHSENEKELARRVAFENVQSFLGIDSEELINIHIGLDKDLKLFLDEKRDLPVYYVGMFHQRYREIASGARIVQWNQIHFPIMSWDKFLNHCEKTKYQNLNPDSSLTVFVLISQAVASMFKEFTRIYKEDTSF